MGVAAAQALSPPSLTVFTPLPPARNGIADYAAALVGALQQGGHFTCAAATEAWHEALPPHPAVPVLDAALAALHLPRGAPVLHQIGNNAQHGFVLRALRACPGVVTLHDPGLLHLHETAAGEPETAILAGMADAPGRLGDVLARQRLDGGGTPRAAHLLCDLTGEVLARACGVIVHSRFARARLVALRRDGARGLPPIAVLPHPLLPGAAAMPDRARARALLGIPADAVLLVTAGFATRAKRFDWLAAALRLLATQGQRVLWIHAGEARPEEVDLAGLIAGLPPPLRPA